MFVVLMTNPSGQISVIGPFRTRNGAGTWTVGKIGKYEVKPVLKLYLADSGEKPVVLTPSDAQLAH